MYIPFGVFSAGTGGETNSFELISTTVLGSSTASVTFDVSTLGSTYKHLQLRMAVRTDRAANLDSIRVQLNNDTAGNYSWHRLIGDGSSVSSGSTTGYAGLIAGYVSGASSTSNVFGAVVKDILDFASTSKNKVSRTLSGTTSSNLIGLNSAAWYNTAAITSLKVVSEASSNLVTGSRISLYGIRG